MAVEGIPCEKMYINWIGEQPELLVNPLKSHIVFVTLQKKSKSHMQMSFSSDSISHSIVSITDSFSIISNFCTLISVNPSTVFVGLTALSISNVNGT